MNQRVHAQRIHLVVHFTPDFTLNVHVVGKLKTTRYDG